MSVEKESGVILGVDISTNTIGICMLEDDDTDFGRILKFAALKPSTPYEIKGIEALFLKKRDFMHKIEEVTNGYDISRIVIEAPLPQSNNLKTVVTLLQFNGMVSDMLYELFGIIPEYISSYEARKYAFPQLMGIRKYAKNGNVHPTNKIISAVKKSKFVLFGSYMWDIAKKEVVQGIVADNFPQIQWLYDAYGRFMKENYDSTDAYVACLGKMKKDKYGELNPIASNIKIDDNFIEFDVKYWHKNEHRKIYFD